MSNITLLLTVESTLIYDSCANRKGQCILSENKNINKQMNNSIVK